jgi:UDP-glucose 4-epimerase
MKVLVTGGAGFIGSHTIIEIIEKTDWEVVSIDNFLNSSNQTLKRIKKITGKEITNINVDLINKDLLFDAVKTIGKIDAIIHFAALKAVGESVEKPLFYYQNNMIGLLNILDVCKTFEIPNLVFSSSCSIYGNASTLPVNENTPFSKAESPYASTKAMGEEVLEHFCKVNSTNVVSLRYFNPVGAHESGLNGENPINKPNNLVPVITQFASGIIPNMFVHGSDYNTRDGSCVRDYIHVTDIAEAHLKAVDFANNNSLEELECFNLGTGNGVSVLEALSAFEKISGMKLNYEMGPRRPGDVESIYSDSTKAKEKLGWIPKFGIEEMMQTAWKWQQQLNSEQLEN